MFVYILDGGSTLHTKAARVHKDYEDKGIYKMLDQVVTELYVKTSPVLYKAISFSNKNQRLMKYLKNGPYRMTFHRVCRKIYKCFMTSQKLDFHPTIVNTLVCLLATHRPLLKRYLIPDTPTWISTKLSNKWEPQALAQIYSFQSDPTRVDPDMRNVCLREISFLKAFSRTASSLAKRLLYIPFTYPWPMLWNAKLTETQIFSELSIEIESSLIELKSSLIQLKSSLIQLESSLIQLESSLIQLESSLYMYN